MSRFLFRVNLVGLAVVLVSSVEWYNPVQLVCVAYSAFVCGVWCDKG